MNITPVNMTRFNFRSNIKRTNNADSIDNKSSNPQSKNEENKTKRTMSRDEFMSYMLEMQAQKSKAQEQKPQVKKAKVQESKDDNQEINQKEKPKSTKRKTSRTSKNSQTTPAPSVGIETSPVLSEYVNTIKSLSPVEKIAYIAEYSINGDLEDKIYEYHDFVSNLLLQNYGRNSGVFKDSHGVKYNCMHDFRTIQVNQFYTGRPYDYDAYFYGYPNGRLPNSKEREQVAFIYPESYDPCDRIEYNFGGFNLDDVHGHTTAIIKNNKIIRLSAGRSWNSPYKTTYYYDEDGNPKSANITVYNEDRNEDKIKNSKVIFDENRKVKKIYYDTKINFYTDEFSAKEVYERDENGKFVLVS